MKNRIVTISREFGSGGRTVGKLTAEALHIPCYDQELIEKIAQESGFTKEYVQEKSEDAAHGNWLANAFSDRSPQGVSMQDYLWSVQCRIILDLAQKGPCVIVGRCADYVLRERTDCLQVFIHAGMDFRRARLHSQHPELREQEWFIEVDMSKYIALIIATLNHDRSISPLLNPMQRIQNLLTRHRAAQMAATQK